MRKENQSSDERLDLKEKAGAVLSRFMADLQKKSC